VIIVDRASSIKSGHIIEALRSSKHVLLDKPLDWSDDELEYLFKLSDEASTLLKIRESFLFHPVIKAAQPLIHNPAFIDYHIDISADTDSDQLQDLITLSIFQCLDAILYLNPARIIKSNTVFSPDLFGLPGVIHGRLEFDNGCIANITCNGYAEQQKSVCYIYQENRHAVLNFVNNRLVIKDKLPGKEKPKSTTLTVKPGDPVAEEIRYFIELILNKSYHLVPFHNYYQSFLLGRKMLQNLLLNTISI
jgi:predicted dehydrogenase